MSPIVEQILQEIDKLSLAEQAQVFRQLGHKNEISATSSKALPILENTAQQQWQQDIDNIRSRDQIDLERQKSRISNMFGKFNEDDDEEDQQEALEVIRNLAKTSI